LPWSTTDEVSSPGGKYSAHVATTEHFRKGVSHLELRLSLGKGHGTVLTFDWRTNTENGIHDCLWLLIDGKHIRPFFGKGLNFSTYSHLIKGSGDHFITWTFNSSGKYSEVWIDSVQLSSIEKAFYP